jgi:hypothetical protein
MVFERIYFADSHTAGILDKEAKYLGVLIPKAFGRRTRMSENGMSCLNNHKSI